MEILLGIGTLIVALATLGYTIHRDSRKERERDELRKSKDSSKSEHSSVTCPPETTRG